MVTTKSPREIALMREAGKVVALIFEEVKPLLKAGVTTLEISSKAEEIMLAHNCKSSSKGYYGYPAAICVSVNDTLVHGIPSKHIKLRDGDIVSLDVVVNYQGYHADAARTYAVGNISLKAQKLIEDTEAGWNYAASKIHAGAHLGDISNAIQEYLESRGYSLPTDFTGHGIGHSMHEDPSIPNTGTKGTGIILEEGMTLAIEPMVAMGKPQVRVLGDGWTAKMKDGSLACHYENTVVVTKEGYEILTIL